MLNHTVRTYLPVFHDQLRTSVLGRATGRKMHSLQQFDAAEDEDDAVPSPATEDHVRAFFDAWDIGADAAQTDALKQIVQTWRADNAMGGVPVHGHLPLPRRFAVRFARLIGEADEVGQMNILNSVVEKFDPVVRSFAGQQIAAEAAQLGGTSERGGSRAGRCAKSRSGARHSSCASG